MNSKIIENRNLYKIFLTLVKYLPMILSVFQIGLTVLNYCGIIAPLLIYFGGTSILFLILLYIISYVFKFCYLFRVPLWYMTAIGILNIVGFYGIIPIDIITQYRIYTIITGFFMTLFIVFMYKNRNKPKVDPIKHFCERYCDC